MYPDTAIQAYVDEWWVNEPGNIYRRGRLVWVYAMHIDLTPYEFVVKGRSDPEAHDKADFEICQLRIHQKNQTRSLPVAAMTKTDDEKYGVYRIKRRPAVVIGDTEKDVIPKELVRDTPKKHYYPTVLVMPYYGATQEGGRAGFRKEFVARIQKCEYPQYFWDKLPLDGAEESILYVNHVQPIGKHQDAIKPTDYCLSRQALKMIDEWIHWFATGRFPPRSVLRYLRESLLAEEAVS